MVRYKTNGHHRDNAETMWSEGVFLGLNARSIEMIIATNDGLTKERIAHAKPEGEVCSVRAIRKKKLSNH